ncbi:MAG: rRNA maturation RNase YbeY [Natronospirillum sp.]|uniref:rRNA maturation RNase YbeY n=1 Tax=Natronospirillum sp. TaxID=2812955 RepID=UPI0025F1060E|nr:rRNA maturation RNase YbeY [Natronospirillum sp.]MCH8551954.1 rRNA maturation RNase YbeY [Natronospirillum sp.]
MTAEVTLQLAAGAADTTPDEARFALWADQVAAHVGRPLALTIRVVEEAESRQLNHDFRGQDKATNVLSFPFEPPPGIEWDDPFIGDLALCAAVILREAEQQQKTPLDHWAHMVIHGTLHLLGHDHQNDKEAAAMEALEIELLNQLNIADPYRMAGETETP